MKFLAFTLIFLLSLCHGTPDVQAFKFDSTKMVRMLDYLRTNEGRFDQMNTSLIYEVYVRKGDDLDTRIREIITTDNKYFYALKVAVKHNFNTLLSELLAGAARFGYSDIEIDLFLLLLIPQLGLEKPQETVNLLFSINLRMVSKPQFMDPTPCEHPSMIGTISFDAIKAYVLHLWTHPSDLAIAYPLYTVHLHNPRLMNIQLHCFRTILKVFDFLFGYIEPLEFDADGVMMLGKLTFLDISKIEDNEIIARIFSAYTSYFVSDGNVAVKLMNMINWNIGFSPLKLAFRSIYRDDMQTVLYLFILTTLKHYHHVHTSISIIKQILELSPFELEPLKNYELAHNLILQFLALAADDEACLKDQLLLKIPGVIDEILAVLGKSPDWPRSLHLKGLLDEEGILNTNVYWILAHFPTLHRAIDGRMLSSATFSQLLTHPYLTSPKILKESVNNLFAFQTRLFGFFDVKAELKILLREPLLNIQRVTQFMKLFRGESDFLLISKLSREKQKARIVVLQYHSDMQCSHLTASIYNQEAESETESGDNTRRLIVKLILAL